MKRVTAEKVNVYKGFRAFEKSRSESRLHAPKAGALPTALHPDETFNEGIIPYFRIKVNEKKKQKIGQRGISGKIEKTT